MTRDEHRAKRIEAMYRLARHHPAAMWHSDAACKGAMTEILDSLHGIVRVVPIEATNEMIKAVAEELDPEYGWIGSISIWNAMSAAGDLTNPPEEKP